MILLAITLKTLLILFILTDHFMIYISNQIRFRLPFAQVPGRTGILEFLSLSPGAYNKKVKVRHVNTKKQKNLHFNFKDWTKDDLITSLLQPTSDVGEAEALCLPRAVGLRVEIEPNTSPGGDEGWRQDGATQPGFPFPRRSQQEPVSQTTP